MRYKGIVRDSKDHPDGLATLLVADDCTRNCKACINQHLKSQESIVDEPTALIDAVIGTSLNNCVVLGGLEWTEQEQDLYDLLEVCRDRRVNAILYTHWSEEQLKQRFPRLFQYDIWIKFGEHDPEQKSYTSHGIPLSSANQYIKRAKLC